MYAQALPAKGRDGQLFATGLPLVSTERDVRRMIRLGFRLAPDEAGSGEDAMAGARHGHGRVDAAFEGLRRLNELEEVRPAHEAGRRRRGVSSLAAQPTASRPQDLAERKQGRKRHGLERDW